MNEYKRNGFKRRVTGGERSMLMIPFNVVMVASIKGNIDPERLSDVFNRLRARHALLAVRVVVDENDVAWFVTKGVPEFNLEVVLRQDENQWIEKSEAEFNIPFPMEKGPLVRFTLLHLC